MVPQLVGKHKSPGALVKVGIDKHNRVALYSLISIAVVRPILTFFLVYELGLGLYGAWIALTLDQTTRAVCSMLGSRQTIRIKMKDSSNS